MVAVLLSIIVILGAPRKIKDFLTWAKGIVTAMTGNAYFPTPTPTLAAISAAIAALDTAETAVATHGKGFTAQRNDAKKALFDLLNHLVDYVQGIAEANMANAAMVVASSGLKLRQRGGYLKPLFAVVQGLVSGSVVCKAKAPGVRATFYWAYSLDGKTWTSVPDTQVAKTTISGLTPGQTYSFRYHTLTRKGGVSDFSQIVTLLVK